VCVCGTGEVGLFCELEEQFVMLTMLELLNSHTGSRTFTGPRLFLCKTSETPHPLGSYMCLYGLNDLGGGAWLTYISEKLDNVALRS